MSAILKPLPKPHISVSQLNMFLRCPAQYRYRYIEGLTLPPKSALTRGKVVHAANEYNYRQKIETREDLPLAEVQEYTAATFEQQAKETEWELGEKPGQAKDESISLATLYHKQIAPIVQPVAVEQEILVEFENADYVLKGFIDVLDEERFIRDTKTTGRTPSEEEATKSMQLTAYSLAHRTMYGEEEAGVKLDYLINTKTPKVVTLEARRTQRDIDRFLNIMGRVVHAIKSEIFYPNPSNFMCSEKNCGYWQKCRTDF